MADTSKKPALEPPLRDPQHRLGHDPAAHLRVPGDPVDERDGHLGDGERVIDDPHFPAAWKPEAEAQGKALDVFRASAGNPVWTYISPAALIEPGERTGKYRVGGEQLLVDAEGNSRISIADYAVALLDRVEKQDAANKRITVAY